MRQLSRKEWPYQARFRLNSMSEFDPRAAWLIDHFGADPKNPNWDWMSVGPFAMIYVFKNVKDYEWFVLRWGHGDY